LMSITRSVSLVAYTSTAPLSPAGTMAALASTKPSKEFSVDTRGCGCPAGQIVRKPRNPVLGTTLTLSEYAFALAGIPHALERTGTRRAVPPGMNGPPRGPLGVRVSMTRHGVTGVNWRPAAGPERLRV